MTIRRSSILSRFGVSGLQPDVVRYAAVPGFSGRLAAVGSDALLGPGLGMKVELFGSPMAWHLGPPLFALPYAMMEGHRRPPRAPPRRAGLIGLLTVAGTVAAVALSGVLATRYVHLLPTPDLNKRPGGHP